MFRVSQHPSSGMLKTVTAASGTGNSISPATSFQRGQVSQHPTSGVLKTVTAASGTGHNIGPATSSQRGQVQDLATTFL